MKMFWHASLGWWVACLGALAFGGDRVESGTETADRAHWAFIPPERPPLPAVSDSSWIRSPIDCFVLAQLDTEQLHPAADADRYEWIRRVSLDLTGLPPTLSEVEEFVIDRSDAAYERVVDRLLRSSRYGEHMARFWLDATRYADTNGYQYDLEREQWVWRDWVIHALNANMPFDQFTIEQLAGDLLPDATDQQRLATAMHRNHPITIEGGVIAEEYRTEYVVDRVVTTSTVWMGLTMMCGRCHDHKYDPISQNDFYSLFAFFNNVPEQGNAAQSTKGANGFDPVLRVESPLRLTERARLAEQLANAEQGVENLLDNESESLAAAEKQVAREERDRWEIVVPPLRQSRGGAELVVQSDQSLLATGPNPETDVYELILDCERVVHAIRLEALTDESLVGGGTGRSHNANFVLSEVQVAVAAAAAPNDFTAVEIATARADYAQQNYPVAAAIDGKIDRHGWAVDGQAKPQNRTATFVLAQPIEPAQTRRRPGFGFLCTTPGAVVIRSAGFASRLPRIRSVTCPPTSRRSSQRTPLCVRQTSRRS